MQQHMGFFASFFSAAMDSMYSAVQGTGEDLKVGKRKRAQRWQQRDNSSSSRGELGGGYYMVPPDRALVPITVYQEEP
jgi:hypothetical protein